MQRKVYTSDAFSKACNRLQELKQIIYANDLGSENAVGAHIDRFQQIANKDDHTSDYDPCQELITILKEEYPKLWNEGGEDIFRKKNLVQ